MRNNDIMLQNMLTAEANLGESCSQSKSTHCLSTEMSPWAPEAKPDYLLVQTSGLSVVRPLQLAPYLTLGNICPQFFCSSKFCSFSAMANKNTVSPSLTKDPKGQRIFRTQNFLDLERHYNKYTIHYVTPRSV